MRTTTALFKLITLSLSLTACSGKYLIKTYPSAAKVYVRDLNSNEKKLVGLSPIQVKEESSLGDVFFLVFEKQNYKDKEVMIRVNPGESLTVSAQLDPLNPSDMNGQELAKNGDKKEDDKPKGGEPPKKKKEDEMDALKEEIAELNLRVALIENTTAFYKDALFSPRFQGGPATHERDKSERIVGLMFEAQQAIAANKLAKASQLIDKAIQKDEYTSQAWLLKGSIKYLEKNFQEAKNSWEKSLKLDPYNKVAYKYLNEVYKKLGEELLPAPPLELRTPASILNIDRRRANKNKKRP